MCQKGCALRLCIVAVRQDARALDCVADGNRMREAAADYK